MPSLAADTQAHLPAQGILAITLPWGHPGQPLCFSPPGGSHLCPVLPGAPHSHADTATTERRCRNSRELSDPWSLSPSQHPGPCSNLRPTESCCSKPFLPSQVPPAFLSEVPASNLMDKSPQWSPSPPPPPLPWRLGVLYTHHPARQVFLSLTDFAPTP